MTVLSWVGLVWRLGSGLLAGALAMPSPTCARLRGRRPARRARPICNVRGTPMELPGTAVRKRRNLLLGRVAWMGLAALLFWTRAGMAVPPGTQIANVAQLTYSRGAQIGLQVLSNEVRVVTVAAPTPSTLEVLAYAPDSSASQWVYVAPTYYSTSGGLQGPYSLSPRPIPLGASLPLTLSSAIPLLPFLEFHVDEAVFVRLTDPDQNLDSLAVDTVFIAVNSPLPADGEVLRLAETNPAAGVFIGYIQSRRSQSAGTIDGSIAATDNSVADLVYVDPTDPSDRSLARARFVAPVEQLFTSIRADRDVTSIGEFLRYTIRVENSGDFALSGISVTNALPNGARYRAGSLALGAQPVSDPLIDPDGRTLRYNISSLGPGAAIELSYVVQVARTQDREMINSVYARSGSVESNLASTTVRLREDLFRNRCLIVGQVRVGPCDDDSSSGADTAVGLPGARVYLEDGTAVLTDPQGFYHFEGVTPGTHVVQLDLADLAGRYAAADFAPDDRHAGRSYSQFVELQAGTMWRADFTVVEEQAPPAPKGRLELTLDGQPADSSVRYSATITNVGVPVTGVEMSVTLPPGMSYVPGSTTIDRALGTGPHMKGQLLTFVWDSLAKVDSVAVEFYASYADLQEDSGLSTQAIVQFDAPGHKRQATPPVIHVLTQTVVHQPSPLPPLALDHRFQSFHAELSPGVLDEIRDIVKMCEGMRIVHVEVTGHSDSTRIKARSRHLYSDNYELSRARAQRVGDALAEAFGLDSSQISVKGAGPDHPIASNRTEEGRDLNRRVELRLITEGKETTLSRLSVTQNQDRVAIETEGESPKPILGLTLPPEIPPHGMPRFTPSGLDSLDDAPAMLWPEAGYYPAVPSIHVAIKHAPGASVRLLLNGSPVAALNMSEVMRSLSGNVELSRWAGIDLRDGNNTLLAVVRDSAGTSPDSLTRDIYYAGPPVRAELAPDLSLLFADGQTPIVVAVRLTDREGRQARAGTIGELSIDPPFVARQEHDLLQSRPLTGLDMHRNQYEVGPDGIARILLMPTSHPGEAVLHLHFRDREQEVRVWIDPRERDWIVVGLTEGTTGYRTVSGNMEQLSADAVDDRYYLDARTAFFAKGRIRGKWLLTMAYDSDRRSAAADRMLEREIDPDAYYTVYGDATDQTFDAPASNKVYVKMERSGFYALFGDFTTGLTVTELTRYNRSFNGAKAELHKPGGQVTAFVSESRQAFVKDEIPGDGTSGPYRLSRTQLMGNSEKVTVETRDRYRTEVILGRRALRRHIDYGIDYLAGTLFLKEPVAERDADYNRIYVVVDYESVDPGDGTYTYGGRAAARVPGQPVEIGASFVHEGAVGARSDIGGVDAKVDLTRATRVKAELAWSSTRNGGATVRGRGYLAEVEHHGGDLTGRAYIREQESGFGLGQQNAAESGTRKLGLEATQRFRERLALEGIAYRQYNLASGGERDLARLRLNYAAERWHFRTGFRYAEDRLTPSIVNNSEHITLGSDYWIAPDRLRLRVDHEQSVGKNRSRDFPTLTRIGAEYWPALPVTLFAEQEYSAGDFGHGADIRLGSRARPWRGAQINSSLNQRRSENGERLFSNLGLRQSVRLDEHWSLDGSLNHTRTISESAVMPFDSAASLAVGSEENYTAVSTGVGRRSSNWSWTSRLELRDGEQSNKYGFTAAAYGEPARGVGLSAAAQLLNDKGVAENTRADIRLGTAFRPSGGRWIALNRLDLLVDRHTQATGRYDNWRLVQNGNLDFVPQPGVQWSMQIGAKYVRDKIGNVSYSGFTGLVGTELRRDLSPKWDFGFHGSVLYSFAVAVSDYSVGMSFGRRLVNNSWVSLGYNVVGFDDRDFSAAGYTARGPFLHFRFKFDQESPREIARALGLFHPDVSPEPE